MNIGVWRPSLLAAALLGGALAGYTGTPTAAVPLAANPAPSQLRVHAEEITVDTLVVSHALTTFADDTAPVSRAVTLNLARASLQSARATAEALPEADLTAAGSTVAVREDVARTLNALSTEVDAMISCEKAKTATCGTAQMILRQSQGGAAAGAAVARLNRAANVDQRFVAVAFTIVQQDLSLAGPASLDTGALRERACLLVPLTRPQPSVPAAKVGQ